MCASTAGRKITVPPLCEESKYQFNWENHKGHYDDVQDSGARDHQDGDLILYFARIEHLHDAFQIGAVAVGDFGMGA
jgi:hypothetical protein